MFHKARKRDFEYFCHKEMISVSGDRDVYLDLNIAKCIHTSKHHMIPHECVPFLKSEFKK
jgi:hypothetical protein